MGFAVKRKFILDTGQFAGSRGASGKAPPELRDADYLDSIGKTASIARHVRTKFYGPPRPTRSEPDDGPVGSVTGPLGYLPCQS